MKIKEIREKESGHILHEMAEKQKHLFDLRSQAVTEKLEDPTQLRKTRKDIARMKTILRERQLVDERTAGQEREAQRAAKRAEESAAARKASRDAKEARRKAKLEARAQRKAGGGTAKVAGQQGGQGGGKKKREKAGAGAATAGGEAANA